MASNKDIFCGLINEIKKHRLNVGKVKFVKLLYLLEWLYYRQNKKRLTDLDWRFLHYGPYPMDFEYVLNESEIEPTQTVIDNERTFFDFSKSSKEEYHLEPEILNLMSYVVQEWGSMDTNSLLNYVYFRTDPMIEAERGEKLDFSQNHEYLHYPKIKMPTLSRDNKKKLKKLMKNFLKNKKETIKCSPKAISDEYLNDALSTMDKIESSSPDIEPVDIIINTCEVIRRIFRILYGMV